VDIDGDEDLDLLVGEKYESVHYYQRQSDGSLKEQPVLIKVEKPDPNLAYMSISPAIFDWNNDGAYDVVIGADVYKSGKTWPLRLYLNKGTAKSPNFSTYDTLKDNTGKVIQARCARVHIADLNLDGKEDLIVGDQKVNVDYYKNVGTKGNPKFERHILIPSDEYGIPVRPDFKQMNGFGYATPRIYDWNKDNKPDLLLSGYPSGEVWIYLNDAATSVEDDAPVVSGIPSLLRVCRCHPEIHISYTLLRPSQVVIKLIDGSGRVVHTLENSFKQAGAHQVKLNEERLSNGVYLVQMSAKELCRVSRFVVVK
jgi:hypothetical protein